MFKLAEERMGFVSQVKEDRDYNYQQFHLRDAEETIFSFDPENHIDAIVSYNYFVAHKKILSKDKLCLADDSALYVVTKNSCRFAKCYLTEKYSLVIGYFHESIEQIESECKYSDLFKLRLLECKFYWTKTFLNTVQKYLETRQTRQGNLVEKENIQILMSDVIKHIKSAELLKTLMNKSGVDEIALYQLEICNELKAANQILSKLHGGRAFLSGNIVEMIMVFEYFKDIYFN